MGGNAQTTVRKAQYNLNTILKDKAIGGVIGVESSSGVAAILRSESSFKFPLSIPFQRKLKSLTLHPRQPF
jgi:hypothetical protein